MKSISAKQKSGKKVGRPATGITPMVGVRLPLEARRAVEKWAANQDDKPTLSEAIRRLVEQALADATTPGRLSSKAVSQASRMAGKAIDSLVDQSAPVKEQERRKRRLIEGPLEFRDMRRGQSVPKTHRRKKPKRS